MANPHTIAVREYHKKATKQYHLQLSRRTDRDVVEMLEAQPNKQGYIKALIRADLRRINDS